MTLSIAEYFQTPGFGKTGYGGVFDLPLGGAGPRFLNGLLRTVGRFGEKNNVDFFKWFCFG